MELPSGIICIAASGVTFVTPTALRTCSWSPDSGDPDAPSNTTKAQPSTSATTTVDPRAFIGHPPLSASDHAPRCRFLARGDGRSPPFTADDIPYAFKASRKPAVFD